MALVPDLDEQACRANARRVLKQYRMLAMMAQRPLVDIKSPIISDMPRTHQSGNGAEASLIERVSDTAGASAELDRINRTLDVIPARSHWLLHYAYCTPEELTAWQIADRIGEPSAKAISYIKPIALLQFAEAYPKQSLLVFKDAN